MNNKHLNNILSEKQIEQIQNSREEKELWAHIERFENIATPHISKSQQDFIDYLAETQGDNFKNLTGEQQKKAGEIYLLKGRERLEEYLNPTGKEQIQLTKENNYSTNLTGKNEYEELEEQLKQHIINASHDERQIKPLYNTLEKIIQHAEEEHDWNEDKFTEYYTKTKDELINYTNKPTTIDKIRKEALRVTFTSMFQGEEKAVERKEYVKKELL